MFTDWLLQLLLNAGAATLALVALGFLGKNLILERLKHAIEHEYTLKLHALKVQQELSLEVLREARSEREAFRTIAHSSLSSAHAATVERRIKAIECLWSNLQGLRAVVPYYVHVVDMLNFERAQYGRTLLSDLAHADLLGTLKPLQAMREEVTKARPFLGDRLYSLFQAAQMIVGRAISGTIEMERNHARAPWHVEAENVALLQSLLSPDEYEQFQRVSDERLHWLIRHLEEKVIAEVQNELSGKPAAERTFINAHKVLETASVSQARGSPGG